MSNISTKLIESSLEEKCELFVLFFHLLLIKISNTSSSIRIINERLSTQARRYYKRGHIVRQAAVFEEFLYNRAPNLDHYGNMDTLELRVLSIAIAMSANQHHLLFTQFDLTP